MHMLFKGLNLISCLAIAACLTPTDPIVRVVIVGKSPFEHSEFHKLITLIPSGRPLATKKVPEELRNILSAEAAANDGFAFPFLSLAVYLTLDSTPRGHHRLDCLWSPM